MVYGAKVMDHDKYPKSLRFKSSDSLRFIIDDARDAIECNPYSMNVEFYYDEIAYCHAELARRGERYSVNYRDQEAVS